MAACQQTPAPATIDLEAEEAAAKEMFAVLRDAMNTQDIETLFSLITDDALIIRSDPTEILNKEETRKMWIELSESLELKFQLFDEQPMVSFWSSSVIPKNEDLQKIVEAIASGE